jgi:hypothetical protein
MTLEVLATIAEQQADPERCMVLLAVAARLRTDQRARHDRVSGPVAGATRVRAESQVAAARTTALWTDGQAASLREIVESELVEQVKAWSP